MSEEAVHVNVADEKLPESATHTVDTPTIQVTDAGVDSTLPISISVGGDVITPIEEKTSNPQKVTEDAPQSETKPPEKHEVAEEKEDKAEEENSEVNKASTSEAVAQSPASDVVNGDYACEAGPGDATNKSPVDETEEKPLETNKAVAMSSVSEIVIIEKRADESSSDEENEDKKTESVCSEKVQTGSVDSSCKPENKDVEEQEGSETASKPQHSQGRRKGHRNRTRSGGQNAAGSRSDTENAVEPGVQQNGSRVRRNSYRRPFRGRGRGRRRGRGRGGYHDGGLSSPPFRQNFGEAWNYGIDADGRYHQQDWDYRVSNANRDRPGYYAARIVTRGVQNKPKSKNEESTASQGNASESGAAESVNNSQSIDGNKRGRRRGNYRNRTRSGRFVPDGYQNNEALGATGGVPVEPKGRQNYYRYYRAPNYNPRHDYQTHGFYHGYYYDAGYNRPYYGYGNGYGYGRGSRGYNNGGGRRGSGYRPRSKSNANQSESTAKSDVPASLNGNTISANGITDPPTTECSS